MKFIVNDQRDVFYEIGKLGLYEQKKKKIVCKLQSSEAFLVKILLNSNKLNCFAWKES